MRRLGADADRRGDLAPADPQPDGLTRQLVTLAGGALYLKLGLPCPVKHHPLLLAQLPPRPAHPTHSINQD